MAAFRFTILDIMKSTAAAERGGKWYQQYLDRGGRWVTIKEGPLEGRHILIDAHGYIMGGKGIPKKVIDRLNGGHIDMTFGKYENNDRKDAVDQTHKELGEQKLTDKKGEWTFHHVSREKYEPDGKHEYRMYVKHDKLAGQTGEGWGLHGGIHLRHDSTIDDLKNRVKNASGYTPDKATLEAMMDHFNKLKAAYDEQDRHYAGGDKAEAQKTVEDLLATAIERAKNGDKVGVKGQEWRERNMKDFEKYLTKEESDKLREAQKVLRGNSQYDHSENTTGMKPGLDTLHGINSHIWQERVNHEKKLEAEAAAKKHAALMGKLDTDPDFRKLVANAVAAKQDKLSDPEHSLTHRLYGYTTTPDSYGEKHDKLQAGMAKHGITGVDAFNGASKLASLGREYTEGGGTLPAVTPNHERQDGKFYIGDKVTDGIGAAKINKIGQKYLHVDTGANREWEKGKAAHHIQVDPIENPQTPEDYAENIMRTFHNFGSVIHGHHMTLESAVRRLLHTRGQNGTYSFTGALRKRQDAAKTPEEKQGIQMVLDEVRRQELPGVIKGTYRKEHLEDELKNLGGARPDRNHTDVDWKEGRNPYEQPTPAPEPTPEPAPAPAPKPAGGGKEGKPVKTGYGDEATMHVPGSKETFKHMKQLKHVHGGKWNGEHQRWEFNHAHGSEGHKALEEYTKGAGIGLNLHEGTEGKGEASPAPAPAPAPEPANEGGKVGKVTIGGNSYPHKFALKTEHGAVWNKDAKQWEVHGVAHGSEKHAAIQNFAKERGLTADHEHDEKIEAPKAPEPGKPKRDLAKETIGGLTSSLPSREEIESHFRHVGSGNAPEEWIKSSTDRAENALKEFKQNPHLIPHGDEDLAYKRGNINPNTDALATAHHTLRHAEEAHEQEKENERQRKEYEEKKRKREEALRSSYPKELETADLSYLQKNPPTLEELQNFYKSRDEIGPAHPAGYISGAPHRLGSTREEDAAEKAKEVHDALKEYLGNPKLHGPMGEHILEQLRGPNGGRTKGGGLLDNLPSHLREAKKRASTGGYTSKIGAKISLSPNDTAHVRGIKGAGTGDAYRVKVTDPTNGRADMKYVPTKWANDKNRIAQTVPGIGQDGVDFIHHVLSGKDPAAFNPDAGPKVKPTSKFEKFANVPDKPKEIDGFMDKAKGDLIAHGASDVAFTSKGTKAQRAKTAHLIATGFRALHHMLGGNLPPVAVTIGPTYSKALAHYSPAGRSIVIDPDKGQNSFFHEFGHFLDDAMHDFKRGNIGSRMAGEIHNPIGSKYENDYHEKSPMAALGKAIKETDSWKNRKADTDGRWRNNRDYSKYFNSDIESFARFFSQWAGHEGRKRGYDLPADLADAKETEFEYGEHYTPEELDKVGEVLKQVFKGKGLLKGLLAFLDSLGAKPLQKFVIVV